MVEPPSNRHTETLHVEVRLSNSGPDPLRDLVVAAYDRFVPPAVYLANPDALDPDGRPLIVFAAEMSPAGLPPGATSSPVHLRLGNPTRARFTFQVTLRAPGNE